MSEAADPTFSHHLSFQKTLQPNPPTLQTRLQWMLPRSLCHRRSCRTARSMKLPAVLLALASLVDGSCLLENKERDGCQRRVVGMADEGSNPIRAENENEDEVGWHCLERRGRPGANHRLAEGRNSLGEPSPNASGQTITWRGLHFKDEEINP